MITSIEQKTLEKLDLLIKALEEGRFDNILNKQEFIDELKNKEQIDHFRSLFATVKEVQTEMNVLKVKLDTVIYETNDIKVDIRALAGLSKSILEMNKKLDNYKYNIESMTNKYGIY